MVVVVETMGADMATARAMAGVAMVHSVMATTRATERNTTQTDCTTTLKEHMKMKDMATTTKTTMATMTMVMISTMIMISTMVMTNTKKRRTLVRTRVAIKILKVNLISFTF